jgi:hypothetical protein
MTQTDDTYRIDHLVLTVQDIERPCTFYAEAPRISTVAFGQGRKALYLGLARDKGAQSFSRASYETKITQGSQGESCYRRAGVALAS